MLHSRVTHKKGDTRTCEKWKFSSMVFDESLNHHVFGEECENFLFGNVEIDIHSVRRPQESDTHIMVNGHKFNNSKETFLREEKF